MPSAAGAQIVRGEDPCTLPRACKNRVEIEGSQRAHVRDGAALHAAIGYLAETGALVAQLRAALERVCAELGLPAPAAGESAAD